MYPLIDTTRIWLVAKNGNDANSGHPSTYPVVTANDAKLTIQQAIANCVIGDTVIIYPGDYDENVTCAIKSNPKVINIFGTHKEICRITPSSGVPLTILDGCNVKNLSCVGATGSYTTGLVLGSGYNAKTGIMLENVYAYGEQDGLLISTCFAAYLQNCYFESLYDAASIRSMLNIFANKCTFKTNGKSSTSSHCLYASGRGAYSECNFIAMTSVANSYEIGAVQLANITTYPDRSVFDRCIFQVEAPIGRTGRVFGLETTHADNTAILNNCILRTNGANASALKDLINTNGKILVSNCDYDLTKITGTITQLGSAAITMNVIPSTIIM